MTKAAAAPDPEAARKLSGAMLEHSGCAAERLPGVAIALDRFMSEAPRALSPLFGEVRGRGAGEPPQATTLFHAIGDCAGLSAAVFASAEPPGRLLIVLDERIDDLIVASVFGEAAAVLDEERPARTGIEFALIEAFAKALGEALGSAFATFGALALTLEKIVTITDPLALGRRDQPAVAARFSLPMNGGPCEGLVLIPQGLLLPFRKALEREPADESPPADSRWSHRMEAQVKQTRLPITAVLEDISMALGDVASLQVGGVLSLQSSNFNAVRLECAGRGMFLCRLGQGDGRYRLELETPIADRAGAVIDASSFGPRRLSFPE